MGAFGAWLNFRQKKNLGKIMVWIFSNFYRRFLRSRPGYLVVAVLACRVRVPLLRVIQHELRVVLVTSRPHRPGSSQAAVL